MDFDFIGSWSLPIHLPFFKLLDSFVFEPAFQTTRVINCQSTVTRHYIIIPVKKSLYHFQRNQNSAAYQQMCLITNTLLYYYAFLTTEYRSPYLHHSLVSAEDLSPLYVFWYTSAITDEKIIQRQQNYFNKYILFSQVFVLNRFIVKLATFSKSCMFRWDVCSGANPKSLRINYLHGNF